MIKHRKVLRLLTVLFSLTLVAAACGGDSDEDTTDTTGDGAAAGEPAQVPGFDGTTISLGVVTPQTGPVQIIGLPLTNGTRAWFDYVNEELGGIAGKYRVELQIGDSQYDPSIGEQQYNAIKDSVVMFAQILGTPIVNAVLDDLKRDNIVAQPASLDSFWVREQNLLPIGSPYQVQAINAMSWYLEDGGGEGKTICTAIQDDPYGEAGQEGIDFAAEEFDFEVATTARFAATETNFTAQVSQLQQANCEAVFLVSTPTTTGALLGRAAASGFAPQWIGQSPTFISALNATPLADYLAANFVYVSEGTFWGDESVPGMQDLLERKEKYAPDQTPDYYFAFGYLEGWAVTQVLERAVEMGDLSREGIIEAMNSLEELTFDGLYGDYQYGPPEDRDPNRIATMFRPDKNAPAGAVVVASGIESDAAKEFEFASE